MNIAITGINATDNPGPGLGVARSLREALGDNDAIIGLSYDVHDPGHYLSKYFQKTFLLPYPNRGWEEMSKRLKLIQRKMAIDVLIPCLDAELPLFIRHQEELYQQGIATFLPTAEQFELQNKDRLDILAEKLRISYPKTWEMHSPDDLTLLLSQGVNFPLFVKGKYYKAYRANSVAEALQHFYSISREWGFPILLQHQVSGN